MKFIIIRENVIDDDLTSDIIGSTIEGVGRILQLEPEQLEDVVGDTVESNTVYIDENTTLSIVDIPGWLDNVNVKMVPMLINNFTTISTLHKIMDVNTTDEERKALISNLNREVSDKYFNNLIHISIESFASNGLENNIMYTFSNMNGHTLREIEKLIDVRH